MKKLLLSLIIMVFAAQLSAQSLTFKYEGEPIEPGTTIDIISDINAMLQIVCDIDVTNTTDNEMTITMEMNDTVNGTRVGTNDFCWGMCYMAGVFTADYTIPANETYTFNGHAVFHNGDWAALPVGTTITIEYTFFDARNPEEKYSFKVNSTYNPESVADFNNVNVFSNAYPNPANSTISFDYNMPFDVNSASIAIYNMMGQEVVKQNLNIGDSRVNINVSDLNEGVYFYSLIVNNETVKTNKFVVSR